jgi:uncharacterized protein
VTSVAAPKNASSSEWKPSRFNMFTAEDPGTLLVYNSFSTAFMRFEGSAADAVASVLSGARAAESSPQFPELTENGLVVPIVADEMERARLLHRSGFEADDHLQLIIMPTEQCNFRCLYCYEDFLIGRMRSDVRDGIVKFVEGEAPNLKTLSVGWFGGEPLSALDIIESLTERFQAICRLHGIDYRADMTTNAYLMTAERAERCFATGITQFQITLDGPKETHDRLRVLANGGPTFDRVVESLVRLRSLPNEYHVRLRVNFVPETVPHLPKLVDFLGRNFAGDKRFSISFHPVAALGGPNDESIERCDEHSADLNEIALMGLALEQGFGLDAWKESLKPFGSVCYAADPRSFVVGANGTVYKCTVAFKDPRNQVGKILPSGEMEVSDELVALWTSSGEEKDAGCRACAFRPACQGNLCPLERLKLEGEKVCPTFKRHPGKLLPLLAAEAMRAG